MTQLLVRSEREGAVGLVLLDSQSKRNRLDLELRAQLAAAVLAHEADESIRAIVLGSTDPKVFAAGADLGLLVDLDAKGVEALQLGRFWSAITGAQKPIVAAVAGVALGAGCELVMMCDFVVADASARFGQPELKVGIMPGAGGTQRLARIVGDHVARWMLLTGEPLTAERAFQLGLVVELTSAEGLRARAVALAQRAADMPTEAVRSTRRVLREGAGLPLDAALALEHQAFLQLFETADKTEGMRAFLEKRAPRWSGR